MNPDNERDLPQHPRHWLLVIVVNALVLTELCVAMYLAVSSPEDFTATFMKAFFGMLIPTMGLGALAKRRLRLSALKA
jgi:hypothetical protein